MWKSLCPSNRAVLKREDLRHVTKAVSGHSVQCKLNGCRPEFDKCKVLIKNSDQMIPEIIKYHSVSCLKNKCCISAPPVLLSDKQIAYLSANLCTFTAHMPHCVRLTDPCLSFYVFHVFMPMTTAFQRIYMLLCRNNTSVVSQRNVSFSLCLHLCPSA